MKIEDYKYSNGEQFYNTTTRAKDSTHSALGFTPSGEPFGLVVSEAQNILILGPKRSGKTETINTILLSMMYHATPHELGIYIASSNSLEYREYEGAPHLRGSLINTESSLRDLIERLKIEMSIRSSKVGESLSNNYHEYNRFVNFDPINFIPQLIIVIDNLENTSKWVEDLQEDIVEIAKFGERVGIHFIVSSGTLSPEVISEEMLEAFKTRIIRGGVSEIYLDKNLAARLLNYPGRVETSIVSSQNEIITIETEMVSQEDKVMMIRDLKDKYPRLRGRDDDYKLYKDVDSHRFKRILEELF